MSRSDPFSLPPQGAADILSISKRAISLLIADEVLVARKADGRTLVDFQSIRAYYESLPLKTASVPIPNAPRDQR
jgi:hypothetical protein